MVLKAPFPYAGGKSRWASDIWKHFGEVGVYAEPFFGSGAVLLQSPRVSPREIVCDKNCMVVNFWRAIQNDPEQVAKWADYPSFHDDLTARHRWLIQWGMDNRERVQVDPDFYDPKAAGWWAWGMSLWIGGGFASVPFIDDDADPVNDGQIPFIRTEGNSGRGVSTHRKELKLDNYNKRPMIFPKDNSGTGVSVHRKDLKPNGDGKRPHIKSSGGGQGVQIQRTDVKPKGDGQRFDINPKGGGKGVQVQRTDMQPKGDGQRPYLDHRSGGRGVSAQRNELKPNGDGQIPYSSKSGGQGVQTQRATHYSSGLIGDGQRLQDWFFQLAERLQNVFVLNREWESAVTPTLLQQTKNSPKPDVAIFLDPPYRTDKGRKENLYANEDQSTKAAKDSYEWAVAYGDKYRIIYCQHAGDFPVPDGWQAKEQTFGHARKGAVDQILISPACITTEQGKLF